MTLQSYRFKFNFILFDENFSLFLFSYITLCNFFLKVVEDGYEFFAKRRLVTLFSAPNYCNEFDNAGAMMSVDSTLMCSFQILRPAERKSRYSESNR